LQTCGVGRESRKRPNREGWRFNRKRVQRLMKKMGLEALVLKRRGLSKPHPDRGLPDCAFGGSRSLIF